MRIAITYLLLGGLRDHTPATRRALNGVGARGASPQSSLALASFFIRERRELGARLEGHRERPDRLRLAGRRDVHKLGVVRPRPIDHRERTTSRASELLSWSRRSTGSEFN